MNYYLDVLKKYIEFKGRASRKEYWMFTLISFIITILLMIGDSFIMNSSENIGILSGLYGLGVLLPSLAVTVRRLHDTSRSGLWVFISFIPLVGAIWLLVLMILDSTPGANQFGSNPKGVAAPQVV